MERKYLYSSLLCPRLYKNCAIIMLSSSRVPRSTVIRCPGESAAAVGVLQGPPGTRPVRAPRTSLTRGPPVRTSSRTRPSSHASAAVRVRASCCLPRFALGRVGCDSLYGPSHGIRRGPLHTKSQEPPLLGILWWRSLFLPDGRARRQAVSLRDGYVGPRRSVRLLVFVTAMEISSESSEPCGLRCLAASNLPVLHYDKEPPSAGPTLTLSPSLP